MRVTTSLFVGIAGTAARPVISGLLLIGGTSDVVVRAKVPVVGHPSRVYFTSVGVMARHWPVYQSRLAVTEPSGCSWPVIVAVCSRTISAKGHVGVGSPGPHTNPPP